MTEMQAAIGRIQLARLPAWRAARQRNAEHLLGALREIEALRCPNPADGVEHGWYKFYAFVRPEALKPDWTRDRIMAEVNAAGVPCFTGGCPEIYREKVFADTDFAPAQRLPNAVTLGETSLMLLVHPTLEAEHMEKTTAVLREVMKDATR
ncbi:hypothetical protein GMDG_08869 [Pseudogymnoascus destructans 20631-21]|uniref:Aminotransferase class I/classII domain-containing protein n=1 Tax=Pseudogymnoascus destructans (strain ATCC MYA-4855 / 20631-21) TaxID=658429 RepID=L8FRE6_PSED2|nr:hypothetical protein GMDG_08869 [Pseudogymnoascus destructans 20631-21]